MANIDASGSLVLPPSIKRLLVEVGGSSANTTLRPGKNTYVVSFQPLLTRYAQMLQQGRRPAHDMFQRLGEHYATQGIVLPFAVDRQPGMQELAVHSASGCGLPGRRCVGASGLRSVEALTMAQALRLTGTLPIEQLRLDVNGAPHPYWPPLPPPSHHHSVLGTTSTGRCPHWTVSALCGPCPLFVDPLTYTTRAGLALLQGASPAEFYRVQEIVLELQCEDGAAACTAQCLDVSTPLLRRLGYAGDCTTHTVPAEARLAIFGFKARTPINSAAQHTRNTNPATSAWWPLFARVQLAELVDGRLLLSSHGNKTQPKRVFIEVIPDPNPSPPHSPPPLTPASPPSPRVWPLVRRSRAMPDICLPARHLNAICVSRQIGCSDFETMDETFARRPAEWKDTLLLSFEPLVDKWATLFARGRTRFGILPDPFDAWPLGRHAPNGVVLPLAIAAESGMRNISVSHTAGCSSLAPFNPLYRPKSKVGYRCIGTRERRVVEAITLDMAVSLVPPGLPIEIKIDAQGIDLQVLMAASAQTLSRVRKISTEVTSDSDACTPLYVGQPRCSTVLREMRRNGFSGACPASPAAWSGLRGSSCEASLWFTRH